MNPFADGVGVYHDMGWPCILPVPPETKSPPPPGFTGETGRDTTVDDLVGWAGTHPAHSIALRLPEGVIGIDVDHYDKGTVSKRGGDTLAQYIEKWGPLPPTWSSTARGQGQPSRIMFYRVPAGRFATRLGESIEIIQRHHRYAVVWPSFHAGAEAVYQWYGQDGAPTFTPPRPDMLPALPFQWVQGLREGASVAGPMASEEYRGRAWLAALCADEREPCSVTVNAATDAAAKMRKSESGTRHDVAMEQVWRLVKLGAEGHPGAGAALLGLGMVWDDLTAGEGREDEFSRLQLGAARKAVTQYGDRLNTFDPCFSMMGLSLPAPAAIDNRPPEVAQASGLPVDEPIEPPMILHPYAVIGAGPFDPKANLDQTLADAVLGRIQPLLRYAPDAGVWLRRGPVVWDTSRDLAEWGISVVARLMPVGDPDADKGSDAFEQVGRRKRLMTAGGSSGIAKKMRAVASGLEHPAAQQLAALDREPWVLWAGGVPFDLRYPELTAARMDANTPHLHSAGVLPEMRPTPLWDAFTAAVWPDPELRAWALRVLGIALTGYSDKALPILVGEKDRGKTQIVALIMSVLGSYAHAADPRLLGSEISQTHASIIFALKGRRLSFIDEGPREGRIGQERLKQLTGGADLTANAMHQDPVTFTPTHTLVLTANDEPTLTDPAIRSRVRLIPCLGDPELVIAARRAIGATAGAAWRAEAPGVLAMMMREAALWLAEPDTAGILACPEAYRYKADEIAAEQDPIRTWMGDETEPGSERANVLYEAFREWCRRNGVGAGLIPSRTKWGTELTRRGYPATHDRGGAVRPLKLRGPSGHGGIMPTAPSVATFMGSSPTVTTEPGPTPPAPRAPEPEPASPSGSAGPNPDDLVTGLGFGDGLVTGQNTNPSQLLSLSPNGSDPLVMGVTGSPTYLTHTHAHAPAHTRARTRAEPNNPSNPSPRHQDPLSPEGDAEPAPLTKREIAAGKRDAARAEALAAAMGELVELPAAVDRAGKITMLKNCDLAGNLLAAIIERAGALTVDVETSGYPVGHADHALRTVQLGDDELAVVLDATDENQAATARLALALAPRLHAHSATADLGPLVAAGIADMSAWLKMHDTAIPAKLADPTSTDNGESLKQLAGALLRATAVSPSANAARADVFKIAKWLTDTELTTPVERSGWAQIDSRCATMVRYAASDVLDTAALVGRLPALPEHIIERERAAQRITAVVNHRGLRIDGEHVGTKLAEHTIAMELAAVRVNALGVSNPGSDQQVGAALVALGAPLPRTPTGRPSVAAAALEALRGIQGPAGPLVDAVLDYRHHETVLSTFLRPYSVLVERGDGRARPTVYTLGTDTGRMSCVRPNMQQLPRAGGVRACIIADPGHVLISADFSGVELRVAAALSQDGNLAKIIAEGDANPEAKNDLHWLIAREVYGPDATKADRYKVKRGVFGHLYGGGIPTLARQMGVSESIAASAVDVLASITPGLAQWSRDIKDAVKRGNTQFQSYSGRVIWLPAEYPHKAPNYCIQGSARELLVDALIRWDATQWGGGVVMPVHDEIVAMVPEDEAEAAIAALTAAMTTNLFGIPIKAEASKPAYAWQDSE